MTEKLDEILDRLAKLDTKTDINYVLLEEFRQDLKDHVRAAEKHEKNDQLRFFKIDQSLVKLDRHATKVTFAAAALITILPLLMGFYQVIYK